MPQAVVGLLALIAARHQPTVPICQAWSCDEVWFDSHVSGWKRPRPELDEGARELWDQANEKDFTNLDMAIKSGIHNSIVMIGDSITENWVRPRLGGVLASIRKKNASPDPVDLHIEGAGLLQKNVLTFAIGGDRIQEVGYRLFNLQGMGRIHAMKPKHVILSIGTNDYGHGEDISVAIKEYKLLIGQILQSLPPNTHLVLQAMLPRGASDWTINNDAYVFQQKLIQAMKEAKTDNVDFFDCSDTFLQGTKLNKSLFHADLLHLTRQGYLNWGRCMSDALGANLTVDATSGPAPFSSIGTRPTA